MLRRWSSQAIIIAVLSLVIEYPAVPSVLAQEPRAAYVGSEACKACHEELFKSFKANARKAHSYASVERLAKKLTPAELKECYGCHTTGYGEPGGFRSAEETPHLKDAGCEVCHGPGSGHADSGDPSDLQVEVTIEGCCRCHSAERVAVFGYKPMLFSGAH